MAAREVLVLVCDLCGSEDMVETHRIAIDGHAVDAEACLPCWQRTLGRFAVWSSAGRRPADKVTRIRAFAWPDTPWKFSAHAMQRMGERHVAPEDVLRVLDCPDVMRPGKASDQEVWSRNGTKVVVIPTRHIIVTVAGAEDVAV